MELGATVVGPAGINLLLIPDFIARIKGVGLPFASDDAVRLVEVGILCVSISVLGPVCRYLHLSIGLNLAHIVVHLDCSLLPLQAAHHQHLRCQQSRQGG